MTTRNHKNLWTDEQEDKLAGMILEGLMDFRQIAKVFGRTPEAIKRKCYAEGLRYKGTESKSHYQNQPPKGDQDMRHAKGKRVNYV